MWQAKDIILKNKDSMQMKMLVRGLESKFLAILDKVCDFRLNYQVLKSLILFRQFEEENLNPTVVSPANDELHLKFQEIFSYF
jgi:hypothetical protein